MLFTAKRMRDNPIHRTDEGDMDFRPRYGTNGSPTKNTPGKRRGGAPGTQRLFNSKLTVTNGPHYYEQFSFTKLRDKDALDDNVAFDMLHVLLRIFGTLR